MTEHICPACKVERADWEGPGRHLAACPNCGSVEIPAMTEQQERRYRVVQQTVSGKWLVIDWPDQYDIAICAWEADAIKIADALEAAETPMQVFMDFEAKWLQAEERVMAAERRVAELETFEQTWKESLRGTAGIAVEVDVLRARDKALRERAEAAERERDRAVHKFQQMADERDEFSDAEYRQRGVIETLRANIALLQPVVDLALKEDVFHERDALKAAYNLAAADVSSLAGAAAKLEAEVERLKAAERERDIAYAEINELGFEAETLKAEVARLQRSTLVAERDVLASQVIDLKAEVERLKEKLEPTLGEMLGL